MPYNRKKVIFTDGVVTVHIIDCESCLLNGNNMVKEVHLLWRNAAIDYCLVKLLVKSVVV